MRKFGLEAAFLSVLLTSLVATPSLGEESTIVVEADGSKHWNNTYGNGYAAARILDRVAETKRQGLEKAKLGLQWQAQAILRATREEEARYQAMQAKERAEYDGLRREYLRLEEDVMQSSRNRLERAENELFELKASDRVQVKKTHSQLKGVRGTIVKIESGEATVDLESGVLQKIPTHQLINLMAVPMNKEERELENHYREAKNQAWDYTRNRLEKVFK